MSEPIRILIVEDDTKLLNLISAYLTSQGFLVSGEARGDLAPERILNEVPDLVILDLMLPGLDGLSILRCVRGSYREPILIMTAREDDMDHVAGLEGGADDYVQKPIVPRVLLARIRAALRRSRSAAPVVNQPDRLCFGDLCIEPEARRVCLDEDEIELSTNEFDVLCYLALNSGKIISRDELYLELKGHGYDGLDRSMDMIISRLRKKFLDDTKAPYRIKTVWGKGYLFVADAWGTP